MTESGFVPAGRQVYLKIGNWLPRVYDCDRCRALHIDTGRVTADTWYSQDSQLYFLERVTGWLNLTFVLVLAGLRSSTDS
jgi:hypothetical protein